jgi:Arc/MetJ-type ribon-helix-helix transcriptional regulator
MMEDIGIDLADRCDRFIQRQLSDGRFASPRQVIEVALALLEEREVRRAQWLAAFEQAEHAHDEGLETSARTPQPSDRAR